MNDLAAAPGAGEKGEIVCSEKRKAKAPRSQRPGLDAAVASGGFVRPLSYQSEPLEEAGLLRRVLTDFEPAPIPIHLVYPAGRHLPSKTRLFIDRAIAALRGRFA